MKLKAPIIPVHNCAQLSPTVPNGEQHPEPGFVNPFGFEQTMKKIELEDQSSEIERLNRQIFQVLIMASESISGISLKLGPMGPFWELVNCASYFGRGGTHVGVGAPPWFRATV